jgi:hypothetical protein
VSTIGVYSGLVRARRESDDTIPRQRVLRIDQVVNVIDAETLAVSREDLDQRIVQDSHLSNLRHHVSPGGQGVPGSGA